MKYKVRVIEVLSRVVEVEADDEIDARLLVEEMYRGEEIVLNSEDFDYTDFLINED